MFWNLKMRENKFTQINILIFCVILSGCAYKNIESYPDTWPQPKVIERNSCPNISGQYGFAEDLDFEMTRTLNFLNDLAGQHAYGPRQNKVVLTHDDDKWFRIETFINNKLDRAQTYTSHNSTLRCVAMGLLLKPPSYEQTGAAGIGRVWTKYTFNLAEDGSLIFQMKSTGAGMVLMIAPAIAKETTWHRLKKINE